MKAKYLALCFSLALPCAAQSSMWFGPLSSAQVPTSGPLVISPAGGHYGTAQTITITNTSSYANVYYTTDGSPATPAGILYTGPFTISANAIINAVAATPTVAQQGVQLTSSGWKCVTDSGGTFGGPTCSSGGGVGTANPSALNWSFGTPMTETLSSTNTSTEVQALYIYSGPGDDSATCLAMDKTFMATASPAHIANNEMDLYAVDNANNVFFMCGLQCNQSGGNSGNWQGANDTDPWINLGVTQGCVNASGVQHHIVWQCHRVPGDTSCGGSQCINFDALSVDGTNNVLTGKNAPVTATAFGSVTGLQDQIDLLPAGSGPGNPNTGSRSIPTESYAAYTCGALVTAMTQTYSFP